MSSIQNSYEQIGYGSFSFLIYKKMNGTFTEYLRITDYVEIAFYISLFIVGLPLNLHAFRLLLVNWQQSKRPLVSRETRFLLLKLHLNISDLCILLIHTPLRVIWMGTFAWLAGDALCRIMEFASMLSFYVTTNIVVCIALDRAITVRNISKHVGANKAYRRVLIMLSTGWALAFLCALPQLYVWRTFEVQPGFVQCTTLWMTQRYMHELSNITVPFKGIYPLELGYEVFHQLQVFWLPMTFLAISHTVIAYRVDLVLRQQRSKMTSYVPRQVPTLGSDETNFNGVEVDATNVAPNSTPHRPTSALTKTSSISSKWSRRSEKKTTCLADVIKPPPVLEVVSAGSSHEEPQSHSAFMSPVSEKRPPALRFDYGSMRPVSQSFCNGLVKPRFNKALTPQLSVAPQISVTPPVIDTPVLTNRNGCVNSTQEHSLLVVVERTTSFTQSRSPSSFSINSSNRSSTSTCSNRASASVNFGDCQAVNVLKKSKGWRKRRNRSIRQFFFVVVTYLTCWAPYSILSVWQIVDTPSFQSFWGSFWEFLKMMIVLNAVIHPFLYKFREITGDSTISLRTDMGIRG